MTGYGRCMRQRLLATGGLIVATLAGGAQPGAGAATSEPGLTARQATCVGQLNKDLSTKARVGQLIWVGMYASDPHGADRYVADYDVGGVVLLGGFHSGVSATRAATGHIASFADPRVKLVVAADQEGGYVQQLQGSGFSTIPTAYYQGRTWTPSTIQTRTAAWAGQLKAAGVNVNLAPVADTVNKDFMPYNRPIGYYQRNYDYVADRVAIDVRAAVGGMHAAGVASTVKHFPGLGRITNNTDTSSTGITDPSTWPGSAYLRPFAAGIDAGTEFVMVSNAYYAKIDPARQAVFSPTVIEGLLRGQLGYQGVVITDDVGAAVAVSSTPVGSRATKFINAGGDIVLTATPSSVPTMLEAIRAARATSPTFKAKLDASVLRILRTKTAMGLTSCS